MRLVMGSWSNGKENLDTGWEMLAKVQVSFSQPWQQCEIGKKKNPWNETCECSLLLKVINQGYSSGSWRGWASPVSQQGFGGTQAPAAVEPCRSDRDLVLLPRVGRSPLPVGFVQVKLLFSHRHKGQVKLDAAVSPPGLCSISKPPEQGCCCASPRLPVITGWVCFVVCFHSYFQRTFGGKKSCFLLSQDSSCWEDVIRAIVTGCTKAGDKVRPGFFPSEMSD